jgi:hypothetical protein
MSPDLSRGSSASFPKLFRHLVEHVSGGVRPTQDSTPQKTTHIHASRRVRTNDPNVRTDKIHALVRGPL